MGQSYLFLTFLLLFLWYSFKDLLAHSLLFDASQSIFFLYLTGSSALSNIFDARAISRASLVSRTLIVRRTDFSGSGYIDLLIVE